MSHPFYNPYASGNHNSTQGQYGLSNTPTERDPRGLPSYLGPGSRFSSFGAPPVIPENSGQPVSASLNYRPEPGRAIRDEDTKSCIDMHIGRAREGVRPPSNPLHQPMDQGTRFTSTQRDDFRSPGTSYAMTSASASLGHKHEVDIGNGSSNVNCLTNYIRPSAGGSILKSSSALSNYTSIPDGRFTNPDERGHDMQTIPGLGDYDRSASDKPPSSTEPFQPMYTYESASSILLQFGLEKEDLEHLISYPEDQITPANLPFILRQIRLQKDKNAATAVQAKPYLEPQPTRTMGSGGAMEKTSSAVLQPSNVIDYGHTSKYTAGVGDDIGMNIDRDNSGGSGNVFVMDTADKRHCREPLQKNTPEFKSSALGSSSEQARSSTSLSSMYGSVLRPVDSPSSDQTKRWQVKPKQTFQDILSSFSQLKKDTDTSALKSEASKLVPLNQQEAHRQSTTSKTQPPSSQTHGIHPSRPGLLLIGSKTPGQRPTVPVKNHQASQQPIQQTQKQPVKKAQNQSIKQVPKQPVQKQPLQQQQSKKQMLQHQKHPVSKKGQVASTGVVACLMKLATSKGQLKNTAAVSKDQPTPEMMFDYAAASPRIFPHTCVLCNKECIDLKDWISHQNSSLHLESCTRLRKQYPKWDGGITLKPRAAGKDAKTPSSTSAKKTRHGSRSRSKSLSPHRRRSSEGRRDKRRSRSRSPQSSKYSSRYDGPTTSSYRSRSQSPERRSSPRRKDDRQSSPRRTRDKRSPIRRSNESWSPPRRVDNRRSPQRRADERWTPPRRAEERWSPLRRVGERQSPSRRSNDSRSPTRRVDKRWSPPPPKRFDTRRSPPRRVAERRSPPGRSAESRSPPGRSQERRSSREGSSPQRKGSNSAESLAKKLLETSAVQSLSNKSDLETMVKTLAPALLAELAKMTSSSSSSSSSLKGGKRSLPASSMRRKKLSSSAPSSTFSSSTAKMKRSATIPSKAKSLLKSEVRLRGIHEGVSQDDVVTAVEHFGKTKSVTLYRSKLEAIARFEKEEDANRLKILKVLDVKGAKVTVVIEKVAVTKKQTKPPLKKPTTSGVSTKTAASRRVLLPSPKIPPLMSSLSSGISQGKARKLVNQKAGAKNSAKVIKTVNKAKVLVSMAKNVSTKMIAKNVKTAKLPVKEEEKTTLAKQETSSGSKSTSPENQPDAGDSKEKLAPENAATTSKGVGMKDAVEVDESANKTVREPAEASSIGERVLVSQAETQAAKDVSVPSKSADSENQPHGESFKLNQPETKVPESSEVHKDTAESGKASPPTMVKLQGIGSSLSHSDVLSAVKHFGKTKSVILVRARLEAVVIFEKEEDAKKLKSVKSLNVNGTEITVVTEKESISKEEKTPLLRPPVSCSASTPAPSNEKVLLPSPSTPKAAEAASTMQKPKSPVDKLPAGEAVKVTAAKDASTPTKSTADNQSDVENSKPQESNIKAQESLEVSEDTAQAAVKANVPVVEHEDRAKVDSAVDAGEPMELGVSGVKEEGNSEPESTTQEQETGAEASQVQQQSAGSKKEAAVEAVTPGGGAETQATQKARTQMDSTSTMEASKAVGEVSSVSTEVPASVKTEPAAAASKQSSAAATGPTIGEMLEKHLFPKDIDAWQPKYLSQILPYGNIHLLISGLPMHYPGFYTETDVAKLLLPFGFKKKEDNLFVFHQARMAFAMMPRVENVLHLTRTAAKRGIFFRGTRLVFEVIKIRYPLTAAQFYTYLKKLLKCSATDEAERTVLIRNISPRQIKELREALKEFGPVANFTPLLNKLFVEFEFVEDADRFDGWYSDVTKALGNKVVRLKGPNINCQSLRPVPAITPQTKAASANDASKTYGNVSAVTEETTVQKPGTSEATPPAAEAETKEGVAEVGTVPSKSEASEKQPDLSEEVNRESAGAGAGLQEKADKPAEITELAAKEAVSNESIAEDVTLSSKCEASDNVPDASIKGPGVQPKDPEEGGLSSQAETVSTTQEPKSQVDKLAEAGANVTASGHEDQSKDANEPMELGEPGHTEQTESSSSQETRTEASVEAETETTQKEMTQMDSTSTKDASRESTPSVGQVSAAACTEVASPVKSKAAASRPSSSSAVTRPTIGEMLEKYLFPKSIHTLLYPHVTALSYNQQLLICGLPTYHDGCYTEDDVADLLVPFGFKNKQEKLYVIPQTRMAFAAMPSLANVYDILQEYKQNGVYFREKRLTIHIVRLRYQMKLLQFYRFLKKVMKCSVIDEAERTVFIRNISTSEIKELREALKEFGPVTNFMPLLNKLFVEFEFVEDAERFGGWYSDVKQTPGQEVIRLKLQGPVTAVTTHPDAALAKDANLTFGERFENYLSRKIIGSFKCKSGTTPKMLISYLPACGEDSYTENDIIELLTPFGYQHKDHNIYVVPQAGLAFVLMPTAGDVSGIMRASRREPIMFKECELSFHALDNTISMRPFWFYESLMARLDYCVTENRDAVIFIRDISPTETKELREALTKMGSIRNFLPLLNKVFVEFQTACDADWLGVWYSLLRRAPGYRIQRLKIPLSTSAPPSPIVPKDCLLDSKDLIDGITIPSVKVSIPQFSPSPFWISLRNSPFVFPTISPWFVIPEYRTVKGLIDIEKASRQGLMCPTIMLTGLPEGNYRHEDVARLVWPYFPKQTLHSLYYNVTVLPLQRRAFVFFSDWTTCCDFVKAHIAKRISLKGRIVGVHFVLQNMYPESSEETMYRSLMKWSNAGVPDPASLEERLLCVEVSEVSLDVITLVIEMVASITTFVNFMPLANRICIEMTDSSSVTQVVEKSKDPSPNSFTEDPAWSKVKNFEPLDSLKQRLQESADVTINLDEPDAIVGKGEPSEIDKDMLKAITVTVGENRLVKKSRSQSVETQGQDDFTDDLFSSDAYLFDEEQFNEEDFVTVDEVYDDVGDSSPEPRRYSSYKHSSRERRERQSSGGSSSHHRTSTRSSRDYKSSASASSSRSNKGSRSSHTSSDLKHSSKPTKSSTKTSSSSSAGKASSPPPPPPVGTESSSSLDKKTKQSSTKSPLKSSSTKRVKIVTVEAWEEPEQGTESAVAKSDHRVSAEGTAAKSVESETEIETTTEMHPPQQEHGLDLNQTQHLEIDLDTNKNQKKSKEDDSGQYQAPKSSDDQTDEQMEGGGQDGSSAPQPTGSEGGQVGDSARDEGVTRPGEYSEMDNEGPLQVRDSVTKDGAATSQEDSGLVQRDGSTLKQLSEDWGPTAERRLQSEIQNEDQPQERDNKQNLRDPDSDDTDQEAFEILDSIDDQTEIEDESEKRAQIPKDDDKPVEDGEEAYEVIDSVGDQPTTTESESEQKQQRPKRGRTVSRKDDRPSRRSGPTSKASKSDAAEESPKKQDRTVKVPETRAKMDSTAGQAGGEETLFEVVDSVEEEHVDEAASRESSARRRSTRGKKDDKVKDDASEKPEEVTYEILDSVENETADEEPTVTRRSTRGKRGRTTEDALNEKTKGEETPTGRRQTTSRESRSREKTPKKDEKAPPKDMKRVRDDGDPSEEVATYEILDSLEDEVLNNQPATRGKGKRGRPKKQVKAAKKDGATSEKVAKDASERAADEEEATYRILDSVEDVDDQPPSDQSGNKSKEIISKNDAKQEQDRTSLEGSTKKEDEEEEEEPLFQIVDSLEDDQVQDELAATEASDGTKTEDESPREEGEKEDAQTSCATVLEATTKLVVEEESLLQRVDDLEEGNEDPSHAEGSDTGEKAKSHGDTVVLEKEIKKKSPEKEQTPSTLVNLDEVSDEEEDYPDDREEEEELRKRQAAAKEKQFPREQEARGRRERERRSRSNSSRGGGGDGWRGRRGKERGREDEKAEVDAQEMVTLDEVGADEAKDETAPERRESEEEAPEGEAQALVTLDEFVDEEAEEKAEPIKLEARPLSQEDESVDDLNQEALVTLDEACCDEEATPRDEYAEKTSKRKHDDDAEEGMNFVIVDEVKDEEKGETSAPRTRGRAKKRTRLTPVRKSTRGKHVSSHEEEKEPSDEVAPSTSNDKDSSKLSSVGELEAQTAAEGEAMTQADIDTASARPELQPEDKTLERRAEIGEEEKEEKSRTDSKDVSKKRRDADGPEAKRSRSQSPSVPADFKMPEFKPDNPLGKEFVVPGYFCNLCSVFYQQESAAKELHCSSQTHFNNLQKHYRELQQKAGRSTPSCQGSFSE